VNAIAQDGLGAGRPKTEVSISDFRMSALELLEDHRYAEAIDACRKRLQGNPQ